MCGIYLLRTCLAIPGEWRGALLVGIALSGPFFAQLVRRPFLRAPCSQTCMPTSPGNRFIQNPIPPQAVGVGAPLGSDFAPIGSEDDFLKNLGYLLLCRHGPAMFFTASIPLIGGRCWSPPWARLPPHRLERRLCMTLGLSSLNPTCRVASARGRWCAESTSTPRSWFAGPESAREGVPG